MRRWARCFGIASLLGERFGWTCAIGLQAYSVPPLLGDRWPALPARQDFGFHPTLTLGGMPATELGFAELRQGLKAFGVIDLAERAQPDTRLYPAWVMHLLTARTLPPRPHYVRPRRFTYRGYASYATGLRGRH